MNKQVVYQVFLILIFGAAHCQSNSSILSLDELAGKWRAAWQDEQTPAISNFHGALQAGRNITSVFNLGIPPYTASRWENIMELGLNDTLVPYINSCSYPYRILRKGITDGLIVETDTRMVFQDNGVLWKIKIQNTINKSVGAKLSFRIGGHIGKYDKQTWAWYSPRPENVPPHSTVPWPSKEGYNLFNISVKSKNCIFEKDTKTPACVSYYFNKPADEILTKDSTGSAVYNILLDPGQILELQIIMTIGSSEKEVMDKSATWSQQFLTIFDQAKTKWEERWSLAFKPNNGFFSGYLPTLVSNEKEIKRIYYSSLLCLFALLRTNLNNDYPRTFVTSSPACSISVFYYWDLVSYSEIWSMLDPVSFKKLLKLLLTIDLRKSYAVDYLTLKPVGPWYAANEYCLFHGVYTYLNVTGDWNFLNEKVSGSDVLTFLEKYSQSWKNLTDGKSLLADYGGAEHLSETVPTYIHKVPFLNAANVWMMRSIADIYEKRGNKELAMEHRRDADALY